jgi:uncharacterized protein with von Willebrand factor type A (vWA) domain
MTKRGATINIFMLDDEPSLVEFVESIARRNGGRVFTTGEDQLGQYVVRDFLSTRSGLRSR